MSALGALSTWWVRRRADGVVRMIAVALVLLATSAVDARAQDRKGPPAGKEKPLPNKAADEAPPARELPPPAVAADEKVNVRRLSDVVVVREGPRAAERVLYYFNPDVELSQGDHVAQGSGGQSDVMLPGGATILLYATAHLELSLLSIEGDVLRFPLLTRLEAGALERPLTLILPGGTQVRLQNTTLLVRVEPGRMLVRNTGEGSVTVTGDLRLERVAEPGQPLGQMNLQLGEEVYIPLFRVSGSETGTLTDLWGLVTVRHHRGLQLAPEGNELRLRRDAGDASAAGEGVVAVVEEASVGGVTTRWLPGSTLVIRNPRHVDVPAAPVVPAAEAPAPEIAPATDAPADAAPAAEPDAAPAPGASDVGGEAPPPDQPPSQAPESGTSMLRTGKESRS